MTNTATAISVGTVYISMWYCTVTNGLYLRVKGKTHKMNIKLSKFDRSQGQAALERMITYNMDAIVDLHLPEYLYGEIDGMNLRFKVPQLDEKTAVTKNSILITYIDFEGDVKFEIYNYTSVPGIDYDADMFMWLIDDMNNIFNTQTHITMCFDEDHAISKALTFYDKFYDADTLGNKPAADIKVTEI